MPSPDLRPDGAHPSLRPPSRRPSRWLPSRRLLAALLAALVAGGGLVATACLAPAAVADGSATPSGRAAADPGQADGDPDGETDLTARAAAPVPAADAERQAQLVQGEDERLLDVRIAGSARQVTYPLRPYRVRSSGFYTLVLTQRRAVYTLDDLRRLAPQTFLPQRDGSFLLREHILVDTGATLALAPERPTTIKLFSGPSGFVSIVSRGGRLRLLGTAAAPLTFTSWDETANRPDTTLRDGRAYLLAQGQLIVRHSTFAALGFWSGRTGGLAIEGAGAPTAGANLTTDTPAPANGTSTTHRQAQVLPAGALPATATSNNEVIAAEVSDSLMDGNTFGLFVTGTSGLTIRNVVIRNSLVHGLVLHRSVTTARIDQVRVERSAGSGVVVTRGVEGVTFSQITSSRNALDGFVITGTPLATGPSPSGGSVRQFGNNVLSASVIENNGRTGIRINGGTSVRLMGNSITGGHQGILVTHGAAAVVIEANRVVGATTNGIQVRNVASVEVTGNSVREAPTGIHLSDSVAKIGDNTVASATLHAVSLIGTIAGTIVRGNTLSGSGSSAVDVSRVTGKIPDIRLNDTGGWQRVITKDGVLSTVMHPLTLVWIGITVLILGTRPIARRARRAPQLPYLEMPTRSEAMAGISHEQRVAIEAILEIEGRAAGWEDIQPAPEPAVPSVAASMPRVTTLSVPAPAAVVGPGHPSGRHPGQAHPTGPGHGPERRGRRSRPALSGATTAEFALPDPAGHGLVRPQYATPQYATPQYAAPQYAAPQYLDLRDDAQPAVGWGPDDPAGESPNDDWLRRMGLSQ